MSVPTKLHCDFEELVYKEFPLRSAPEFPIKPSYQLHYALQEILTGRSWAEIVGFRLIYGDLDRTLINWIEFVPMSIVYYCLPAHLIFASIELRSPMTEYHEKVAEAFILPIGASEKELKEIDRELNVVQSVILHGKARMDLFNIMTPGQRQCVAKFLELFFEYEKQHFSERGIELFWRNRDVWLGKC